MTDERQETQAPPRPPMRRGPMGGGPMGMMAMPGEKSMDFWPSAKRLIGRLRPERALVVLVILLGVVSVTFSVLGPKILGDAVNTIFEGAISRNLPAGVTQDEVVAAARNAGQAQLADMLATINKALRTSYYQKKMDLALTTGSMKHSLTITSVAGSSTFSLRYYSI